MPAGPTGRTGANLRSGYLGLSSIDGSGRPLALVGPMPMSETSPATSPATGSARSSDPASAEARPARGNDLIWKFVAVAAGVLLAGFIAYVATRSHHARTVAYPVTPVSTLTVTSTAPAFALPRLGGGPPVELASTRGTPTVVNFFASWCRNCQAELGGFAALDSRTQGREAVIGVDANDADSAAAQALLAKVHATYPVGVDSQATTATAYLLRALPVTFFLDAQGRVVHVALGTQSATPLSHWTAVLTGTAE